MAEGTATTWSSSVLAAHARGSGAHPRLALALDAFGAHAVRCARSRLARRGEEPTEDAVAAAVGACDAADLYLAAAGVGRVAGAWERLEVEHAERLVALARSRGAPVSEAEQQVAELWSDLAVAADGSGRAPPLAQYDGTGRLFSWLATCLLRRIAARAKATASRRPLPESAAAAPTGTGEDPAAGAERRELEAALKVAVGRAVAGLTPQERAALVFAHRDGWSGKEVARLLGVGEPRVSRLRSSATEKVRAEVIPVLSAHGLVGPRDESWSALREAVSMTLAGVAIPGRHPSPGVENPSARPPHDG